MNRIKNIEQARGSPGVVVYGSLLLLAAGVLSTIANIWRKKVNATVFEPYLVSFTEYQNEKHI